MSLILVFVVIFAVLLALWREWLEPELAALSGMAILLVTGILSPSQISGALANPALVTVACMFVLSAALERTGVIAELGARFCRLAGKSEWRALLLITAIPLCVSPFVNNTPIVVILMPVVLGFCRDSGVNASRLLIPLSFAAIMGGTISIVGTSTNLLVDGAARKLGQPAFSMFEIAPLGLITAAVGMAYLLTVGRKFLPDRASARAIFRPELKRQFLVQTVVSPGSRLIGKPVNQSPVLRSGRAMALEVKRHGLAMRENLEKLPLKVGDRVLLRADGASVKSLDRELKLADESGLELLEKRNALWAEAIVGPNARFLGSTIREAGFLTDYGVQVIAMHRQGHELREDFEDLPLQFGDVLLILAEHDSAGALLEMGDFINLSETPGQAPRRDRAWIAVGVMAAFIVLGIAGIDPFILALTGAILVLVTRCVEPAEAYAAIEWRILFLIAGMLGIGVALESSGGAAMVAGIFTNWLEPFGAVVVLSGLYLLASVLTEIISNNAVAILLAPISIEVAEKMGSDPRAFLVAVMFGASASFATPIGYQTNTYVYGPGGYTFRDFVKIGLPLNLLLWLTATICIPLIWKV